MEPIVVIVLALGAMIALGAATVYAVWPRAPEPDPEAGLFPQPVIPTETEQVTAAIDRLGREVGAHGDRMGAALRGLGEALELDGIRLQAGLAGLGATLGHELRRWPPDSTLPVHMSEREHPLAEALPKDRDDFRYLSDTTRRAAVPGPDPIQAARDRILRLVERPHIEMAQRVMALAFDRRFSFDRVYDLAAIGVPPHEWIRMLEVVRRWEHGEELTGAVRMAPPTFPPGEVSFEPSGRPPGDGDTPVERR